MPAAWVARIRESMALLTPQFSTNRSERDYTEQYYLPAATAYRARAANNGAAGKRIVDQRHRLDQSWDALRFGTVRSERSDGQHVFEIEVFLGDLDPRAVRVELYADGRDGSPARRCEMERSGQPAGTAGSTTYRAAVCASRAAEDYTARLMPRGEGRIMPLEDAKIRWQR